MEVLNSIKIGQRWRHNISGRQQPLGSHVKFNSLLQKTKMPGAPTLQSLLKISIGQNNQLFMGNILPTLDFFCFQLILRFHVNRKKSLGQQFNKTVVFYNFFRNALEILGLKSWDLKTFCVFIVDVASSVGRFPIVQLFGYRLMYVLTS